MNLQDVVDLHPMIRPLPIDTPQFRQRDKRVHGDIQLARVIQISQSAKEPQLDSELSMYVHVARMGMVYEIK